MEMRISNVSNGWSESSMAKEEENQESDKEQNQERRLKEGSVKCVLLKSQTPSLMFDS